MVLLCSLVLVTQQACEVPGLNCTDQKDNDMDGLVDCEDPDCCGEPICEAEPACVPEGCVLDNGYFYCNGQGTKFSCDDWCADIGEVCIEAQQDAHNDCSEFLAEPAPCDFLMYDGCCLCA
jgi:hypothetical protein